MYKSITLWRDLTDGHLYNAGDPFPWDGRTIPDERIEQLSTPQNKAGFALIKAVEGAKGQTVKEEAGTAEIAEKTAENTVENTVEEVVEETAESNVEETAENAAEKAVEETAEETVEKPKRQTRKKKE